MQLIGEGRTATVHALGSDRVWKRYRPFLPESEVRNEYRVSRYAAEAGLDVPHVFGIEERDGAWGIVFERIEGDPMLRRMVAEPASLDVYARRMAELHLAVHACEVPETAGLPDQKGYLAGRIRHADRLEEHEKNRLLAMLSELPSATALCHGDYHPDNIMLGSRAWIIDWSNGLRGHPAGDVARTWLLLTFGTMPDDLPASVRETLDRMRLRIRDAYLASYLEGARLKRDDIDDWFLPVAAARLVEGLPEPECLAVLAFVREQLAAADEPAGVALRPVEREDLPVFFAHQRDAEANRMAAFTAQDPHDRSAFDARWQRVLNGERHAARTILFEGEVAGNVLAFPSEEGMMIAYWIGRDYWGRGVATAGLALFLKAYGTRPLFARAAKDNAASLRVLARNGFSIVGEDRGFANARGEEIEEFVLRLGDEA
ncbi:GNAT family N-acetyltransferase [Cohnella sp. REN36]|uniref:GNAT family N-acetyltransferase n=1 Tax=Cohnella sp. REN36 TaxID=2887347 RepID=UPI001D15D231|nr:GNAT family N-acetyltransferase [Cohnella sp. REN36]MCC3377213.1 GNAT family N-acetyltransferase [Cohnella sp. REN36]